MGERYNILREINSNDFSVVYEVIESTTEDHYAMKIIKGINSSLSNVIFEREVGALNKLRACENIVRIEYYDIYEHNTFGKCGRIYMEYIDGDNLQDIDVLELNIYEKYKIIEQLINAIVTAHENNIIHRDINPKNVMFFEDGKVKLIDFGISKIKDMINTDTLYQFATNGYAAPEVHQHNENATEESDIYSLGAVIYYLFTGESPLIAYKFEDLMEETNGMDIELKEIVKKMTRYLPNERYNNIFEVKKAFSKFLLKFNNNNNNFVVLIDTGKIQHMKNMSLVPNDDYQTILDGYISDDFLDSYIFITNEGTNDERYELYGNHYYFQCIYNDDKQLFQVSDVRKLQPFRRAEIKKKALHIEGEIKFIKYNNKVPVNDNFELTIAVKESKKDYLSSLNVNNEYTKNFSSWHKLLEIMEEEYKNKIIRINYDSYKIEGNYCIFSIKEIDYYKLDQINKEINFIIESSTSKKAKAIEIGYFKSLYIENNDFFMKVNITNRDFSNKIETKGTLCEDYRSNLALVAREKNALNSFNNEDYVSTSNLKSIFSCVQSPSSFKSPKNIVFFNKNLDAAQKRAVSKALNTQDIALIQGPPGTGKTNVIIEILRQVLEQNNIGKIFKQKILLVSQAHTAVDKMLEDLYESSDEYRKVIRIGREENLSEMVKEKYAIEYAQSKWVSKIVQESIEFANEMLSNLNIDKDEFNKYYNSKLDINYVDKNCTNDIKNYIDYFEDKYKSQIDTNIFNSLIIQKDWINRIIGRTDIQQHFIKNSEIVCGTCTGFVSNNVIKDMVFDYVVIDEAAKATFPELIISIIKGKKVIMVGDHKQLPPILDEELIKNNKQKFIESGVEFETLYNSIFKKLFESISKENKQVLNTQYRMHPVIGDMIGELFYDNQIQNGVSGEERKHCITKYDGLAIIWIDTSKCVDRFEENYFKTYRNTLEASIVKEQLKLIDECIEGFNYDVGIITPYSGQKNLIRNEIQQVNYRNLTNKVTVNSVDAFQGGQKDIIIYSTVRSGDKNKTMGFLKSDERLNVAFSRAKRLLIIIGDAQFLGLTSKDESKFPQIIKYIKKKPQSCKLVEYLTLRNENKEAK